LRPGPISKRILGCLALCTACVGGVAGTANADAYFAPSDANLPNLFARDRLSVDGDYYETHAPSRGDVVALSPPDAKPDRRVVYIDRIIGLPGERVQMRAARLYINDEQVPQREVGPFKDPTVRTGPTYTLYIETLPGPPAREHKIIRYRDDLPANDTEIYTVPPDSYFVMGDNRDNCRDSRGAYGFGFVPAANLLGRVESVTGPPDRVGPVE